MSTERAIIFAVLVLLFKEIGILEVIRNILIKSTKNDQKNLFDVEDLEEPIENEEEVLEEEEELEMKEDSNETEDTFAEEENSDNVEEEKTNDSNVSDEEINENEDGSDEEHEEEMKEAEEAEEENFNEEEKEIDCSSDEECAETIRRAFNYFPWRKSVDGDISKVLKTKNVSNEEIENNKKKLDRVQEFEFKPHDRESFGEEIMKKINERRSKQERTIGRRPFSFKSLTRTPPRIIEEGYPKITFVDKNTVKFEEEPGDVFYLTAPDVESIKEMSRMRQIYEIRKKRNHISDILNKPTFIL